MSTSRTRFRYCSQGPWRLCEANKNEAEESFATCEAVLGVMREGCRMRTPAREQQAINNKC